ncbi:hypothetical protein BVX97_01965 [bacterium E08(2017)]|nr:hypothetical protein BVX97_01965 [bacterium E08(2017)]
MLLIITVFALLFGGAAMMARPRVDHLKSIMSQQEQVQWQITRDKQFVDKKDVVAKKYVDVSKYLPPATREDMGVHWQQVLERIAGKNKVKLVNSRAGLEKKSGDVYEILIDCRQWEGELEDTVRFLFDLQAEGAMLDVRRLLIRSTDGKLLRGTFSLYCIYTREEDESAGREEKAEGAAQPAVPEMVK